MTEKSLLKYCLDDFNLTMDNEGNKMIYFFLK